MSGPSHHAPGPSPVRLTPDAQRQLDALSRPRAVVVQLRLARRGAAEAEAGGREMQAQLIGTSFRAVYEVDHGRAAVTVLDEEGRG